MAKKTRIKTRREVSAGGILYRQGGNSLEVCLIAHTNRSVWGLPKGKVEPNEQFEETARREIKEETGLEGELERALGSINYWFYSKQDKARVFKTVHFFLFRHTGGAIQGHDFEVEEVAWLPIDEAIRRMTYASEREMVEQVRTALKR